MESYTMKDISRQLRAIDAIRGSLGIDPELTRYEVNEGNKSNGIAFRIYGFRAGETGHAHVSVVRDSMGYLGMTKREAYDILSNVKTALAAAADALNIHVKYPDAS